MKHEFLLGCNGFELVGIEEELQEVYRDKFAAVLNFATLPFYWGGYEAAEGKTKRDDLAKMADWCITKNITTKGHPLLWHEVFPKWAEALDDAEVMKRQKERLQQLVKDFKGKVDIWDVVNEATTSHRFDNTIGRWIKGQGSDKAVGEALAWAREAGPEATLLYNDFNVSPEFEEIMKKLLDAGAPVDVCGIQSHMHSEPWSIEKAWQVCESYAKFGLPLHFTELTILSGKLKAKDDYDWHKVRTDWHSTPEGEKAQLELGKDFYTTLFSHPAVEAITWWNFSDYKCWQGAPGGLVRKDMTSKPFYEWLVDSFNNRWTTQGEVVTDSDGRASFEGFFGEYEVEGDVKGRFTVSSGKTSEIKVKVEE